MFRPDQPRHYEEVYASLVSRLATVDFRWLADGLGAQYESGSLVISSFGESYRVTKAGITDLAGSVPPIDLRMVLAYYVLQGGTAELSGQWVSFRDFKDTAFFMATYKDTVERPIAELFSGQLEALKACSQLLGGQDLPELGTGDRCYRYPALPNLPLALVYYDADEELPASATVLYDLHSTFFLDLECLAVLGLILKERLSAARQQLFS
ncbi:MAG: DUF3786 domain-containing protein [Desulfobacca sp.]|nr:DUF3786 domain-containing protein [Desulfobacca sp.]